MVYLPTPWETARNIGRKAFKDRLSRISLVETYRGDSLLTSIVAGWDDANEEYLKVLNNGVSPSG